ncbi:hypothetical protein Nisw_05555 [Candidatus Nitrosopumilus sp. SW]|uniref:hypothetical protein n=1 Tax=Candidatus Nitrosopumilus sp. SW TaxID=2508726 RepID=UPI00038081D9|nr:hypothetical protein [Candidatus Nitrosopumilus sp. SW]QDI89028.1 hypothetical protein Nisw_05555 [Candidatus Nitrosopumilus sp. SW]
MSLVLMNSCRGTKSFISDKSHHHRFVKNNHSTRLSKEGLKLTIQKGTKSHRITQKPKVGIPVSHRIIIVNRGTLRLNLP